MAAKLRIAFLQPFIEPVFRTETGVDVSRYGAEDPLTFPRGFPDPGEKLVVPHPGDKGKGLVILMSDCQGIELTVVHEVKVFHFQYTVPYSGEQGLLYHACGAPDTAVPVDVGIHKVLGEENVLQSGVRTALQGQFPVNEVEPAYYVSVVLDAVGNAAEEGIPVEVIELIGVEGA